MLAALLLAVLPAALGAALPDLDAPLRTGARTPADAGVVVGIEDYAFVQDVPYAARDARAAWGWLVYTRGVPADRVRLLDAGASRERILEAVTAAGRSTGPDGVVWIWFAGHGAADGSTGERLLLGDDVRPDPATFGSRGVKLADIEALAGAGGAAVHLFVDACYGGVGRAGEELVSGKRFLVPAHATAAAPRTLAWHAAGPDQFSGPFEAAQHGAFTWFALGALRGWADGQLDGRRDGRVTAEEALLYVNRSLQALQVTAQRSELVTSDPSRLVLVEGDALETGPDLDTLLATRTPAGVPRPAGAMDPADRAEVTAWLDQSVTACWERHGGGDGSLARWFVRFKIHPSKGLKGLMLSAPEATASTGMQAVYTCLREEIRGQDFARPPRAVTWSGYAQVPGVAIPEVRLDAASELPAMASPPVAASSGGVVLVLRAPAGDWLDVRVDGAVVAEFRNQREVRVTVAPGLHTVELARFMEEAPFAAGTLDASGGGEVVLGLDATTGITGYTPGTWQAR